MKNRIFSSLFLPLFLTSLTLLTQSSALAQIPSSGLVGYWPFNSNANDESGNGNNGTVNGATLTTDRFGNASSAYNFDGVNDFIDAGIFYNFGTANFTVSCWFKLVPTSGNASLVSKREVNMWGNWWVQEVNGFQIDESAQSSILTLTHPTPLNKQLWTNYIIIREGNILSFYVNGVLSDQETLPTAYNMSNNANLLFGTTFVDGSYVGLLKGKLDDISIYNRAIDSEEISSLFTTTTSTIATPPCPTLATNLQTGLVGYWPFCGNANDESGNGNNGTVNGATLTTDRFGNANSAYSFDGVNDWIEVANDPSITLTGNMTMSAWVKTNGSNGQNYQSIISKRETYWTWEYMMTLSYHSGIVHENKLLTARALGAGNQEQAWTELNYSTSTWEYWTVAYSQGQVSLYKNGLLDHTEPFSMVPVSQNCPLLFGRNTLVDNSEQFFGSIDDISIYNRTLTPAEISQIYSSQSTPPVACTPFLGEDQTVCAGTSVTLSASSTSSSAACPTLPSNLQTGLVGYWPFCGNANDASGNGNNGTVNGATLTTDRFGNANNAYAFDGVNDYVDLGNLNYISTGVSGEYTVSLWVNPASLGDYPADNLGSLLFGDEIYQNNGVVLSLHNSFGFNVYTVGSNNISICNCVPNLNEWINYTVTQNSNGISLYINGAYDMLLSNSINSETTTPTRIGYFYQLQTRAFHGVIDDVTVHNRALTAAEIQQLYTLGQSTYLWSNGATTPTINVSPTSTTTYICTVTDANGNVCTDSVTVFVPQIEATDLTICAGETTTLSVSGINSTVTPFACPTLPTNLQTGLVGYWPFCGNANDASGNGNNGTVNGATLTTDRFGNANSAYAFNVNSLTSIGVSNLNVLNDWSIAFWCNPSNSNTSFLYYPIGINCQLYWKGIGLSGNNPPCGIPGQNLFLFDGSQGCSNWFAANSVFNYNSFNQFVITKSGLEYRIYQNGTLLNSSSSLEAISIQSLTLGRRCNDPSTNTLDGTIDDVILHNRALTINEIQQLYTLGQTTYLWSNGATTPTINVSPTTTTTYTCTVTTNGVSCTDSVTVIVSNPVIDLGADVNVCGTSTTLTAPSGYDSYVWSNSGTTNTTTVSANGTYSCTVTQGGCSATDAVDVTLVNATISASDSTICAGETVTLSVPQGGSTNTACAALPTNLQIGLVGYWPFCGNANDASGNGNNGSVNGATLTTDRFGNANSAYYFNGSSSMVSCGYNSAFNLTGNQTISYWYKAEPNSNNAFSSILSKDNGGGPQNKYIFGLGYNGVQGDFFMYGPTPQGFLEIHPANQVNSEWNFITWVFSPTEVKLYRNGIYVQSFSMAYSVPFISEQLVIGASENSFFWKGEIDDVAFWNRQLSSSEILVMNNLMYSWSNGATTPTINVSPTSTTTYTCTITSNGVSCTDSVTVVVSNPVIDLGADVTVCGTSTTLTAPSGYDSYLWSNGGTTNTTTVTANGTYSCTVTQGGCSASDSIDVTLIDATITASDSTICAGETVNLGVMNCPSLSGGLDNGLVGFWPFCGNANDESGNNFDGVVAAANLTADRFGSQNSAYQLNGANSQISTPFLGILGGNSRTISFWADVDPFVSELTVIQYGSSSSANGGSDRFGCKFANNGTPSVGIDIDGSQVTYAFPNLFSGWHLFTYTFSSSDVNSINNVRIYADGNLLTTLTQNYIPFPAAGVLNTTADLPLTFGGNQYNNVYYNGFLDDVAVYNRALSTSEIQELYTLNSSSFEWSTGATTPTINVSPATTTTYTCTVTTNGVSCTDSVTVVVSQAVASITPNGIVEICQGQSIALTANGGVSYLWNTGAPTQSITVNTEAVYTVTVTDANGCTDTESQLVKVNLLPNIGVNNSAICPGQSTTLTATGGLSYVWSPATGLSSTTGTTVTASPSTSTVYTVTGTGANGCTNTATAAVLVNAASTATITPATATTFCQGGSVVLNANTGTGLSYQWRLNGTNITGATSASYTANASGSYTVVVTNTSTCSATSTPTVVTVNALPTATITPATATTFCQGGSVVLNANTGAGLSYQWYNNAVAISGATTSTYTAIASGSYTVLVTNTSTCSATSAATVVTVNALPTATITPATATTFCQGGSVVLNANTGSGLSYQWFNNAVAISGATSSTYTANASGSYTVIVTNTSTCSATSAATVVTVNALPTATITPATATSFCQGGSVVLNANTGAGLTYQWRLNGNPISGATLSSYTANASGSYTVVVTNTSTCSATSAATVVTVNALPIASISPNGLVEICQGQSIALTANGGVTYLWNTGAPTQSITVNTEALYTVTVTDINGCTDTESQFVKVNQLPNIGVNNASICVGQSATLTATGGLSYVWSPATGLSGTTGSTVSSSTTTTAVYTVTGTGANGCTNSATATVTVNALPTATITPATATTFCQGGSVVLNANTGAGLSYQWFNNAVAISGATTSAYTANASGSYTVVVTNTSACSATSTATVVTVVPNVNYYADADGDGFGDAATLLSTCIQPQGYVTDNTDCDDTSADVNLAATEVCNHIDDDCSGSIDDGLVFNTYYADADGDTYGDANNSIYECSQPINYVTNNTDCNDNNANQNIASTEICNGEDDDCDGAIDNGLIFLDFYSDIDGDGFGAGDVISSCSDLGIGYSTNNTDCDDTNSGVYPGAQELCNSIDDNCDGQTDDGTLTVYFIDNDGDTYGNPSVSILACTQPIGYTPDDTDCNDTDANINPGAEDIGGNGIDENCDGQIDNSILELNSTIALYPNPTSSELNIQINSSIIGNDLYIFDAVGKLVFKQQLLSTQTTISVSNFADGNYVVRVGEVVKRFVVEK